VTRTRYVFAFGWISKTSRHKHLCMSRDNISLETATWQERNSVLQNDRSVQMCWMGANTYFAFSNVSVSSNRMCIGNILVCLVTANFEGNQKSSSGSKAGCTGIIVFWLQRKILTTLKKSFVSKSKYRRKTSKQCIVLKFVFVFLYNKQFLTQVLG